MKRAGLLLIPLLIAIPFLLPKSSADLEWQWNWQDQNPLIRDLLKQNEETFRGNSDSLGIHDVQIIFTRIDRDREGKPGFTHFHLGEAADHWFAPASLVKLPVSAIALERINEYKDLGLTRDSRMETGMDFSCQTMRDRDTSALSGFPSVAQDIRKIFLVSDNDAYSRLYEWIGQCPLNSRLQAMGFDKSRIVRRFAPCNAEENRHTNPITFYGSNGKVVFKQPGAICRAEFTAPLGSVLRGAKHENAEGTIVDGPFDFSYRNYIPLRDLHQMMISIVFPDAMPARKQFQLSNDDLNFLRKSMATYPTESKKPGYDRKKVPDGYAKYFFFPLVDDRRPAGLRILSKVGQSYGYMSEIAYVVDAENGVEFFLSAVVYANANRTMNDGKYEYETVCRPFLGKLGYAVYQAERERIKSVNPDLSEYKW